MATPAATASEAEEPLHCSRCMGPSRSHTHAPSLSVALGPSLSHCGEKVAFAPPFFVAPLFMPQLFFLLFLGHHLVAFCAFSVWQFLIMGVAFVVVVVVELFI